MQSNEDPAAGAGRGWGKDLLGLRGVGREAILQVLHQAQAMLPLATEKRRRWEPLRGRVVVNLFYEPSTRTRISFELAARALGADVINVTTAQSSVVKGESLVDTARTLQALGADLVVLRHPASGAPHRVAQAVPVGVVNAGDGTNEHPTQGLLDLFTIWQLKGRLEGVRVVLVGDILHSRVARSNLWGLSAVGAQVGFCGPATLLPRPQDVPGVRFFSRLEDALEWADVVNMLRLQRERQVHGYLPALGEYRQRFGLTAQRLRRLRPDVLVMHPGPANVGVEIDEEVLADPRSAISRQVSFGVAVRMAVLSLWCGQGELSR